MSHRLRLGFVVGILAGCWSCGPTPQVAGDWSGRVAPAHFDLLQLRLTQDGKVIRGTACFVEGPDQVVFRDATVTGMYPTLQVDTAALNGFRFVGEFQDDGTLRGQWRNASTSDYPMSLTRATALTAACL